MNNDLLWDVSLEIEENPTQYDQHTWFLPADKWQFMGDSDDDNQCRTSHCVAGWAVKIAVPQVYEWLTIFSDPGQCFDDEQNELIINEMFSIFQNGTGMSTEDYDDDEDDYWEYFARKLLDLSKKDARYLFDGNGRGKYKTSPAQALQKMATGTPIREIWNNRPPKPIIVTWEDDE